MKDKVFADITDEALCEKVDYSQVALTPGVPMSEYAKGEKSMRDIVIATMCGWQNNMGHGNPDDPEYKAYQRVIMQFIDYKL